MTDMDQNPPSRQAITELLELLAPGSALIAVGELPGSFSNFTHVVQAQDAHGSPLRLVVRRYAVFGSYDRGEKAAREFKTYELVMQHGIPAPQPLYLDIEGRHLGIPGIVTSFVAGEMVLSPPDPGPWARVLASTLARIHAVPCSAEGESFLLDANSEASWFLRAGAPPEYMQKHPLGTAVWQTTRDHFPRLQETPPALVHIDYWPGNVLWDGDGISAVVDWEEASYGDTAIDVAYCRMNMAIKGHAQAAAEFLRAYEEEMGRRVANLAFWELAAAARPMFDPQGWQITESPRRERFARFIENAMERIGA
jgi:aminoglycoside phosphotransferase (APT) family kinase protein